MTDEPEDKTATETETPAKCPACDRDFDVEVDTDEFVSTPGIDRPGYWDEVKLVATMAAHMYPHIDGGPAQAVETAQLILQETHKAIDADLEPELAEPKPAGEVS